MACNVVVISLLNTMVQLEKTPYPFPFIGKLRLGALIHNMLVPLLKVFNKTPEALKSLETRIRDTTNEAEDIVEHFVHEHIRSTAAGVATDIDYDFGELDMVLAEFIIIFDLMKQELENLRSPPAMLPSSPTPTPAADIFTVVGLDEQVEKLRVQLCEEPPIHHAIAITGMGGIGKTTLARTLYEDEQVVNTFPVRAWIVASQNFQTETFFEELLLSLEKQVDKGLVKDGDTTEEKISQILTLNKYLIVVDDLWSAGAWEKISYIFDDPVEGSRIMITTRDDSVASLAISYKKPYKMGLMDEAESWCMLKQKVFGSKECPEELEKIGKDIAKGCKGLPLATAVAARILSQTNQTQPSWEEVANNIRSLIVEDAHFGMIMSLSYIHLPIHLKAYFLYMCGFPEDYEIRSSMLVKLWMAEGFDIDFESRGGAERYSQDLVYSNVAIANATKSNGNVKSCSIHDLVRALFQRKALDENFERRFSNSHLDLREVARSYASTLRSVISFQPNESSLRGLRKFKLLRVLDIVDTDVYSLPASVFDLFHLRYLAFGCPMEVPSAISRLQKLQSLIIRPSKRSRKYSTDEVYLPSEILLMPVLTHLVSFSDIFPNLEGADAVMEELLTLCVVKKLICTEEMMKLIYRVSKLAITYSGDIYQQDYQLHNLVLLSQLEKLTLVVKKGSLLRLKASPVFPKTLKKLTLSGWRFPWKDMKAIGTLPHLQVLKLRDHAFQGDTWSTIGEINEEFGLNFNELLYLLIEESDLEKWAIDEHQFPNLKHLVLKDCGKLNQIPKHIGYKERLQIIEVERANLSLFDCVQEIKKEHGSSLEVREL